MIFSCLWVKTPFLPKRVTLSILTSHPDFSSLSEIFPIVLLASVIRSHFILPFSISTGKTMKAFDLTSISHGLHFTTSTRKETEFSWRVLTLILPTEGWFLISRNILSRFLFSPSIVTMPHPALPE